MQTPCREGFRALSQYLIDRLQEENPLIYLYAATAGPGSTWLAEMGDYTLVADSRQNILDWILWGEGTGALGTGLLKYNQGWTNNSGASVTVTHWLLAWALTDGDPPALLGVETLVSPQTIPNGGSILFQAGVVFELCDE